MPPSILDTRTHCPVSIKVMSLAGVSQDGLLDAAL
jgi:hypothetical protein